MPLLRVLTPWLVAAAAFAADAPAPAPKPADATAPSAPSAPVAPAALDPTATIVAEGRQVYRQRDIDALVLIATRHRKGRLAAGEEEQLKHALARLLVAREPLLDALASLPPGLANGKARDALLLDLLEYRAEAAPDAQAPSAPAAAATGAAPAAAPATAPAAKGPVLVSLPALTQTRTLEKLGKRQLTLSIALCFPDAATADRFEPQAPLIRDAILGHLHQMPPEAFAEPDQVALKQGLVAAVRARLADFPADGILIPELDAGAAGATGAASAAEPEPPAAR